MKNISIAVAVALACIIAVTFAKNIEETETQENAISAEEAQKNLELIEYYVNKTKLSPYSKFIVESGLKRIKRAGGTRGDNTHWCCKEDPVYNKEYHTRAVRELVPVTKTRRGSGKCGFGGWSRCTRDETYTTGEVHYKQVVDTREVTAAEWVNGCPDRKIVCCKGFILNKFVNNCMTNAELDELLKILHRNEAALPLLERFGQGK
ncbi:unnamed protein product [Owenia fusiformis]|uniref:Uncharacterized protein n=1 Tax=Owenia fusiformis TaxID=6347 RepID=A0A8J1XLW7_OWEFU|nr:unnamed protein product [Owenia fusiformis]